MITRPRITPRKRALALAVAVSVLAHVASAQAPAVERIPSGDAIRLREIDPRLAGRLVDLQRIDRMIDRQHIVLSGARVVVPVEPDPRRTADVELLAVRRDGLEPAPDAMGRAGPDTFLQLERGVLYVLRDDAARPAFERMSAERLLLPDRIVYAPTEAETPGAAPQVLTFALFLALERAPVPWVSGRNAYHTNVIAGLMEVSDDAGGTGAAGSPILPALERPISIRFTTSRATVAPSTVSIDRVGVEGYRTTALSLDRAAADARVTAISDLGETALEFDVDSAGIVLYLVAAKTTIRGYGLGTTGLTVIRRTEDGTPIFGGDQLISLQVSGGHAPDEVVIPAQKDRATVTLRSEATGEIEVIAFGSDRVRSEPITIAFVFPILLLMATLLGALVGGLVEWVQEKYLRSAADRAPPKLVPRLFVGLVAGLLLEVVLALGLSRVEFLDVARTEAGAFIFSLIGGFLGMTTIDVVLKWLGFASPAPSALGANDG